MKPSLPSIPSPENCGTIRYKYADVGQTQQFIQTIQGKIDSLSAYVSNSLASDLKSVQEANDPGVLLKNLVRYVRIEKKTGNRTPNTLNFNQVMVYDENSNNISVLKAARSSSSLRTTTSAVYGVNGKIGQRTNNFISKEEASPWWEVDLGESKQVNKVVFRNRIDSGSLKAQSFQLLVLNQNRETITSFPLTGSLIQEFTIASPSNQSQVINQKVAALRETEKELQQAMGCLDKEINQRQSISSEIYALQGTVKEKEKVVDTKHANVQAARERAHLLRDPNSETTVWESWFPLGRPLEKQSVPVLWFFSIVFLILTIGLFLQMAGFKLDIGTKVSQMSAVVSQTGTALGSAVEKAKGAIQGRGPVPTAPPINIK
jgi:hypothetical protein